MLTEAYVSSFAEALPSLIADMKPSRRDGFGAAGVVVADSIGLFILFPCVCCHRWRLSFAAGGS